MKAWSRGGSHTASGRRAVEGRARLWSRPVQRPWGKSLPGAQRVTGSPGMAEARQRAGRSVHPGAAQRRGVPIGPSRARLAGIGARTPWGWVVRVALL